MDVVPGGVDLVDRDDLARLRIREEILVVKTPPRSRVAAEALALEPRIRARARPHVDDAHLEDVARHGTLHRHRARDESIRDKRDESGKKRACRRDESIRDKRDESGKKRACGAAEAILARSRRRGFERAT